MQVNTCAMDADCGPSATCREGMCIAQGVASPLAVTLEVIPRVMPDGSPGLPIRLESFALGGATVREWSLPSAVALNGRVEDAGQPVQAEIRLVPVDALPGIEARAVTTSTMGSGDGSFRVQLVDGVDYRMTVTPVGSPLPPLRLEVRAEEGAEATVDYAELALEARQFVLEGAPAGMPILLRAVDGAGTAQTAAVPVEDDRATLLFLPEVDVFRVEIAPVADEAIAAEADASASPCEHVNAHYPTLAIDHADLPKKDGAYRIALPEPPIPIRFQGSVELCPTALSDGSSVESLPIAVRASALEATAGSVFAGSFSAKGTAVLDDTTGGLGFCVEVLPGDYEVVVTPPASMQCAIFAEQRLLKAPAAEQAATGALLILPETATLAGTLQTIDHQPLGGATVDAQALGRVGGIELAEDDLSLTRYNRSRQVTSDDGGVFTLGVDLGVYDVVVKPPAAGGFPWQVLTDVNVGTRDVEFVTIIDVGSPVPIEGALAYRRGSGGLEGAEVRAFITIDAPEGAGRAVHVGSATVDGEGRFTLLLSSQARSGWY